MPHQKPPPTTELTDEERHIIGSTTVTSIIYAVLTLCYSLHDINTVWGMITTSSVFFIVLAIIFLFFAQQLKLAARYLELPQLLWVLLPDRKTANSQQKYTFKEILNTTFLLDLQIKRFPPTGPPAAVSMH
ncbi:MAG: hypothetical protein EI684_05300 [Candidatus Viridilinea halotolerans]|uniref:Uncharacterized protein n=1 Tax=Candidatus Viridilinea halotolerans TaxID=2491704 RepID=A0A426U5J2_9CHLR|nr:MAG: hypothetical protein EI684_05300 [Candidatus Viridilinea halotolerans]